MHSRNLLIPVGDSHCTFLAGARPTGGAISSYPDETPSFFWLGPAKIWGLDHKTANNTREKFLEFRKNVLRDPNVIPVVALGEIDIRVNIGHLCVKRGGFSPIRELVDFYLKQISQLSHRLVILWGPPPTLYESENLEYPAVFDSQSRNCLTHLFNKEIIAQLNSYPNIKFATLFYNFVDDQLRTTGGLSDGIHYDTKYSFLARSMISSLVDNCSKVVLNIEAFARIGSISFKYENSSTFKTGGFSSHLYETQEPSLMHFFMHRNLALNSPWKIIQIRPVDTTCDRSSLVDLNSVVLTQFEDLLHKYFCYFGSLAAPSLRLLLKDISIHKSNIFDGSYRIDDSLIYKLTNYILVLENSDIRTQSDFFKLKAASDVP
jgi:hypothetical protein